MFYKTIWCRIRSFKVFLVDFVQEAAVKSEKEALESQRNRFAAMIENFVETFRSVPAKDSMEKGGILEQIDQKIREGNFYLFIWRFLVL